MSIYGVFSNSDLTLQPAQNKASQKNGAADNSFGSLLQSVQSEGNKAEKSAVKEEFLAFARLSPAEKMRALLLKEKGLTEDQLASMPADERQKIENELKREIEERLSRKMEDESGIMKSQA